MLMISVAVGTAVGMNSLISRRLGEQRIEDANRAAGNGLVLMVISSLFFTCIGLFLSGAFMRWQDNDPIVRLFGTEYMTICLSLSVGIFLSVGIERIMTAQGRTMVAMMMQLTGAVSNIVLDRIFVLGLGPIPAMGVTGAAIATVAGQFASMTLALIMLTRSKSEIQLKRPHFNVRRQTVKDIYSVGVPSILMQAVGTVMYLGMNGILKGLGEYHVAERSGPKIHRYQRGHGDHVLSTGGVRGGDRLPGLPLQRHAQDRQPHRCHHRLRGDLRHGAPHQPADGPSHHGHPAADGLRHCLGLPPDLRVP